MKFATNIMTWPRPAKSKSGSTKLSGALGSCRKSCKVSDGDPIIKLTGGGFRPADRPRRQSNIPVQGSHEFQNNESATICGVWSTVGVANPGSRDSRARRGGSTRSSEGCRDQSQRYWERCGALQNHDSAADS